MTSAGNSKAVFLMLFIHCLLLLPLFCRDVFCCHYLVSSFAIISLGKKVNWPLYFSCLLMLFTVSVLCLFLMVLWVGLQCVIVEFPCHIHLLFHVILLSSISKIPTGSTICCKLAG